MASIRTKINMLHFICTYYRTTCLYLVLPLLITVGYANNEDATQPNDEIPAEIGEETTRESTRPQVFEGRTGPFEFIAPDSLSLQSVRDIARLVLRTTDRLITLPDERLPRISVRLVPEGRGNLEEGELYRIYEDMIGDFGLAVSWQENLPVSLFCNLLTEVYLKQVVFTMANRETAELVPSWLIAAISLDVQVQLRPTLVEFLQYMGRNQPMVDLEDLFTPRSMEEISMSDRISAYWFVQLILRSMDSSQAVRDFFDQVIDRRNPLRVLQSTAQEAGRQPEELEAWWVIGYQDMIHSPSGFVESMERSRKRFSDLSRFEWIVDGRPRVATVGDLWEFRNVPVVAEEIDMRLRLVEGWLPRVNPIYYNSYQNLGLIFISILDNDEEAFTQHVDRMMDEWDSSLLIEEDVQVLLLDPDSDL